MADVLPIGRSRMDDGTQPDRAAHIDPLVRDLLTWVAEQPRPYKDVMEAWRSSCPHLTIFEDAMDAGLICRSVADDGSVLIVATARGRAALGAGWHNDDARVTCHDG